VVYIGRNLKLEQIGLLDRAKELHEQGHGSREIVSILKQEYPDKAKDIPSHMGVERALAIVEQRKVHEQIVQGLDPVEEMNNEFKQKMDGNTEKLAHIEKKANEILNEAMESDSIADKTKALKEVRDTLAQISKNYVNLQQWYQMRVKNIENEAQEQKKEIEKVLVEWLTIVEENVCPICKERTIPKIMHLVKAGKSEEDNKEDLNV
jgi:DNA-binding ferritin-like protein